MTKVCVQQQTGGSDFGLFVIAFAVALAHGQDPATLTFDQQAMREHLRLCLQAKRVDPFPTLKKLKFKKNRVVGREVESLYCLCRGIWVVGFTCTQTKILMHKSLKRLTPTCSYRLHVMCL